MNRQIDVLKKTARMAGLLYFIMAVTGAYSIVYVPSRIVIHDNALATANNILNNEFIFRSGLLSSLICQTVFIFLALILYRLLRHVNENLAKTMVALVLVAVPIAFLITFNELVALLILKEGFMTAIPASQQNAMVMLLLTVFESENLVIGIFWGLWLLPFGWLIYKSGFIPKIFGLLLIAGGLAYLIDACVFILLPQIHTWTNPMVAFVSSIAELSIVSWLLVTGVRQPHHLPVPSNSQ